MAQINYRRIFLFLGLAFLLSSGFDWLLVIISSNNIYRNLGMNPWGMLVPAFAALCLRIFLFKDSTIYFRTYKEKPRWIFSDHNNLLWLARTDSRFITRFRTNYSRRWCTFIYALDAFYFIASQSVSQTREKEGLKLGNIGNGQRFILRIYGLIFLQLSLVSYFAIRFGKVI